MPWRSFPKASAKVELFFELANYLEFFLKKVEKKINYAFLNTQFSKLYIKNYKKTSSYKEDFS